MVLKHNDLQWIRIGLLGLIFLVVSSCSSQKPKTEYITKKIVVGDIRDIVPAWGTVEAAGTFIVSSEISGRVAEVLVSPESAITKGQLLARLDDGPIKALLAQKTYDLSIAKASLKESEARLGNKKENLHRSSELAKKGSFPKSKIVSLQYEVAELEAILVRKLAAVKVAEAKIRQVELDISRSEIRSPIDGFVLERRIEPGDVINANQAAPELFKVATSLVEVFIRARVAERDISRIHIGMKTRFQVDAHRSEVFETKIVAILRAPVRVGKFVSYEVLCATRDPQERLYPGMTASVEFVNSEAKQVTLMPIAGLYFQPTEYEPEIDPKVLQRSGFSTAGMDETTKRIALTGFEAGMLYRQGYRRVFVWEAGEVIMKRVKVGFEDDTNIEVAGGDLKVDDLVIIGNSNVAG